MAYLVRVQKAFTKLLNKLDWTVEDQTSWEEIDKFLAFINSLGPYQITQGVDRGQWTLRNKKTHKVIDL